MVAAAAGPVLITMDRSGRTTACYGNEIALRARHEADVPVLHAEPYNDVATRSRADLRPWRPIAPGSAASPYAASEPTDGEALLRGIDLHNLAAHLGISLRPAFRGRGLGTDVVRVLCRYGFVVRGMHRLQVETLADNAAMVRAATRAGFMLEGTLRRAACG
jgi:RimJ/RimL family protein N-acetyltransferase